MPPLSVTVSSAMLRTTYTSFGSRSGSTTMAIDDAGGAGGSGQGVGKVR
jgi:hypothetical protein